jgi:hypothetical protein
MPKIQICFPEARIDNNNGKDSAENQNYARSLFALKKFYKKFG